MNITNVANKPAEFVFDEKTKAALEVHAKEVNQQLKMKQSLGQDDFLKLLVTELAHQDPLEPMDNKEFIAQMANFSSLEQMYSMNKSIDKLIGSNKVSNSYNLIGKEVSYVDEVSKNIEKGNVSGLLLGKDGVLLKIGNKNINNEAVIEINEAKAHNLAKNQYTETAEQAYNESIEAKKPYNGMLGKH